MKKILFVTLALALLLVPVLAYADDGGGPGYDLIPGKEFGGYIGKNGQSWRAIHLKNSMTFEGATSDGIELRFLITDPTSTDKFITFPQETGTIITTGGSGLITPAMIENGTDAQMLFSTPTTTQWGSGSGFWVISNAGVATGQLADANVYIGNSAGEAIAQTISQDLEILNSGAARTLGINGTTIGNTIATGGNVLINNGSTWNSRGFSNTILIIQGVTATNTYAMPTNSQLIDVNPISGFSNAVTITKVGVASNIVTVNIDTASGDASVEIIYLAP